ncbi:uncharacterized protein LOC144903802 [Branchiostoma floridae x Branchiostoma belcheri]
MSSSTPSVDTIQTTGKPVSYSLERTTTANPLNMSSPTPSAATTLTTGQPACCSTETTRMADSSYMSTTRTTVSPAFMISTSSESSDGDAKSDKIVFGGKGTGIGKFKTNSGVVVSTNNEIFVADMHNRRVQIFTIDGAFLGNFSTVVPGENDIAMLPYDIAIDGKANLWVVGKHIFVNEKPSQW